MKLRRIGEMVVGAIMWLTLGAIMLVTPVGQVAILIALLTSPFWLLLYAGKSIRIAIRWLRRPEPVPHYTYPPMVKTTEYDAEAERVYRAAMDAELQRVKAETMEWLRNQEAL